MKRARESRRVLGACAALFAVACGQAPAPSSGAPSTSTSASAHVETALVALQPMPRVTMLTGSLEAEQRVELSANTGGRVLRTYVERGQRVAKGAIIAQLDTRIARASVAEASANLASAKAELGGSQAECARHDALLAKGAITAQEHAKQKAVCERDHAALDVARAKATTASIGVGDGTVRAPFAGIIADRAVSAGDWVQTTTKVATLIASERIRVISTVPERRIADARLGARVSFSPVALPGRTFTGEITHLGGEVRAATRDRVVEASVPNPDGALLPGMFVDVALHTGDESVPTMPSAALVREGSDVFVWLLRDKRLSKRLVRVGSSAGDLVAVEEGASVGDAVVKNPGPSLVDGQTVE